MAAMLVASPGARAENGINAVGTLERFPQEAFDAFGPGIRPSGPLGQKAEIVGGTLIPVPGAGQLWQVYPSSPAQAPARTWVLVRDAKTLKVLRTLVLPHELRRATVSVAYGGEWLHTTDGGNRVFLVTQAGNLLEVNASTFEVLARPLPTGTLSTPSPLVIAGLSFDHATGNLLILYGGPANSTTLNHLTVLQQLDLATGGTVDRVVRSCTGPLPATDIGGDTYATAPLVDADAIYVPCQKAVLPLPVQTPTAAVVRLPRASLLDSTGPETSVDLGTPMDAALLDPSVGRITVL